MRNIIEELYYGNITPCDRDIVKGGTYSHLLHLVTRNEDDLMQTLTQAQQETFEKFKDCACVSVCNKSSSFRVTKCSRWEYVPPLTMSRSQGVMLP